MRIAGAFLDGKLDFRFEKQRESRTLLLIDTFN